MQNNTIPQYLESEKTILTKLDKVRGEIVASTELRAIGFLSQHHIAMDQLIAWDVQIFSSKVHAGGEVVFVRVQDVKAALGRSVVLPARLLCADVSVSLRGIVGWLKARKIDVLRRPNSPNSEVFVRRVDVMQILESLKRVSLPQQSLPSPENQLPIVPMINVQEKILTLLEAILAIVRTLATRSECQNELLEKIGEHFELVKKANPHIFKIIQNNLATQGDILKRIDVICKELGVEAR
ncbi:MAG: hypothetical protein ABTR07_06005 [Candidatus Competibacter denitrificans]